MPREMNPSVVYIVKGEGVRDNSWELQQPPHPVVYTNPPLEQLDSVPTPLGSDLSIRIFEKGTKPIPDYLPAPALRPPATSVVAAQAAPVSPAVASPRKTSMKTVSPVPPATTRQSSAVSAPAPSAKAPKPVVRADPLAAAASVARPVTQQPRRPLKPPRLRNFRRPFAAVIADPTKMPRVNATRPAALPSSSAPLRAEQSRPAQPRLPQPRVAQPPAVQAKPPPVSAPTAVPVSAKATPGTAPSIGPKKPSLPTATAGAPVSPAVRAPDISPMEISPPKLRPPAPVKPSPPAIPAQKTALASPPKASKGAPPVPELPIPGFSSPPKTMRKQQQVTSPSAFGRWRTSSPVSPNDQSSPPLPSPTKRKASAVEEKMRAKPWDKHKTSKSPKTSFEVQRKAMDTIVAKALAHQSKPTKALPPLVPLTPPASRPFQTAPSKPGPSQPGPSQPGPSQPGPSQPRPSQPGPVSPKVPPAKALTAEAVLKRPSPSIPKRREPAEGIPKESESVKDIQQQPRRPDEKHISRQQRPTVDVHVKERRVEAVKSPVKPPTVDPIPKPKEPARKAPVTAPSKRTDRRLLEKEVQRPSHAATRASSSTKPSAAASAKVSAVKSSATISTPHSVSEKHRVQSAKAAPDVRSATSPRSSIDGYEIGTAARPIVTKEDQAMARRKREVAAAGSKAPRPSEQPVRRKASSSEVHKVKEQRASDSVAGPSKSSVSKTLARTESNDLFSSEVQDAMKSVIEQIMWTVRHYKQRYEISNHDEMNSNKKRILRFIQTHLEDAVPGSRVNSVAAHGPPTAAGSLEADNLLTHQSSLTRKESATAKEDLQHMDLSDIRVLEMFKSWRRHLEQGDAPLQTLAVDAKQLRQTVANLDPDVLHFTVPELLNRLGELGELTFSIRKLEDRLSAAGRKINVDTPLNKHVEELHDAFRTIKSAARWVLFLSDQTSLKYEKLHKAPTEAAQFAMDVYDALLSESSTPDSTVASKSIVKAMRDLKSVVALLQNEGKLDGDSFFEAVGTLSRNLGMICRAGKNFREQGIEPAAAPLPPPQDRAAPRSPTVRPDPIPRRPRHEDKPESNQESRSIKRRTQESSSAAAAPSSATQKPSFESRGRARTPNGSSPTPTTPKLPMSPKSLPVVPRRPPKAEAPEDSAPVPSSQVGPSTQRAAPGSRPRWVADRPNLRTLMEKSARPVDQMREDISRDSAQAGTKRKADGKVDQNGSDPEARETKKRRVKFAPVLVQGEQSTPYSFAALQSLFYDGYDLLGDTTELQKKAVEERASQLSRGSVIALFGFIRSYIAALKAEKDGQSCQRPVWVKLPYTPSMKRDILRFAERRGPGRRNAPGP